MERTAKKGARRVRKSGIFRCLAAALALTALCGCSGAENEPSAAYQNVAMGSAVSVQVYGGEAAAARAAAEDAYDAVQALDVQVLSKNASSSELYRLNHTDAAALPAKVSDELFGVLQRTKEIYSASGGRASLASGALTQLWGMDTDEFRVPASSEIERALPLCSDDTVTLDEAARTVSFLPGQVLNLGSVGKGAGCDKAAAVLQEAVEAGFLRGGVVSVGGSVATVGTWTEDGEPWRVGVRDPFGGANVYFAALTVGETYISTSGSYEKQFTENGKTYHHILDLTTGYPAKTDLVSVTVTARTGLESDALSTLCFLLGEQAAQPVLESFGAEALFVYADKTVSASAGLSGAVELLDTAYTFREAA